LLGIAAARVPAARRAERVLGVDDSVFLIAPANPGRYQYRWIVAGRAVACWNVTIGLGD
jgi:hypothetical protein